MRNTFLYVITSIFVLLGCTEEVIVPEYIDRWRDSIVYRDRVVARVDTVKQSIVITETDTLWRIEIDSVFIETIVYEYDTIYHHTHTYHDTLVQFVFPGHNAYYVEPELQPIYESFIEEARERGWLVGAEILITYANDPNDIPGDGWVSTSFFHAQQYMILLSPDIDPDHLFTPIYRELGRLYLNKKYTRDNTIMDPLFDPYKFTMDSPGLEPYLDKLFAR